MRVEVEIPKGRNCGACLFCQEVIDSWGYEESHNWCAYLKEDLNKDVPYSGWVKKSKSCPEQRLKKEA